MLVVSTDAVVSYSAFSFQFLTNFGKAGGDCPPYSMVATPLVFNAHDYTKVAQQYKWQKVVIFLIVHGYPV